MYDSEIWARSASVSNENLGHSEEKEQHAPQVRHEAASSSADCFDNSVIGSLTSPMKGYVVAGSDDIDLK
jgi:hypothetical protein